MTTPTQAQIDDAKIMIDVLRKDVRTLLAIITHHIEATGENVDPEDRAILDEIISDFAGDEHVALGPHAKDEILRRWRESDGAMTTPTQAQIEAFRKAMPSWWRRGAAQKKEETEEIIRCLTAAAQVGEQTILNDSGPPWRLDAKETIRAIQAATVERCAQVADEWNKGIGKKIRKLKDDAAITAAAQVGETPKYGDDLVRLIVDAAEMSDGDTKELFLEAADALVGWSSANKKMKATTIERCAQVAWAEIQDEDLAIEVREAIRKLKDEP